MDIKNFNFGIPLLKDEISNNSHILDDNIYMEYSIKYNDFIEILIKKDIDLIFQEAKNQLSFPETKYKKIDKKYFLINLLKAKDPKDEIFKNKLKQILPNGIHGGYICTDLEYELLIKEFNI